MYDHVLYQMPSITAPSDFLRAHRSILFICNTIIGLDVTYYLFWRFSSRRTRKRERIENQTTPESQMAGSGEVEKPQPWVLRVVFLVFACSGYVFKDTKIGWLVYGNVRFWEHDCLRFFFPETPYSLTNLEQAVAALSGALVLSLNLYSAGRLLYRERQARLRKERNNQDSVATPGQRNWHGHASDHVSSNE